MKKILFSVLVLWAAGAYSQEIRMPEEKRKEYVKEERKASNSTSLERSESSDSGEDERRQRALEARKKALSAQSPATSGKTVYCNIKEITPPNGNTSKMKVIIETDSGFEERMKGLDKPTLKDMSVVIQKPNYKSALEALNTFSMNGWELVHVSEFLDTSTEMIIRNYMIGYRIP